MTIPDADANLEVVLVRTPHELPQRADFAIVEREIPNPGPGQVLVRNRLLSVDPYMRIRMHGADGYMPPYELGETLDGAGLGHVIASNSPELAVGDAVVHNLGWRMYSVGSADAFHRIDTTTVPEHEYLNALGLAGSTAYVGLLGIGAMQPGDRVFVSGAAGAVGSLVGQIARLRGASVIVGSAGSAEKISLLTSDFGFDSGFDYHGGELAAKLDEALPEGIDVFFDNVGGDQLEAAISRMRLFGRIVLCGSISEYNADEPVPGPANLFTLVAKNLTMRGFLTGYFPELAENFVADMTGWLAEGSVASQNTIVEGIENMPDAFIDLLLGRNVGKMLVRV